ncbi:Temperature sensing protein-like protein [Hirschfeldia incana]|nr:Temperature sensing protein-like protein [Hirschfeldia incana]
MKEEEVNRCQIQNWYPKFKSLTIKTKLHKLPESFISYLLDDSGPFLLPDSITNENAMPNRVHNPEEENDDFQLSESSSSDNESDPPPPPPSFPEIEIEIKESIEALGGAIFPKLNWSAPKDAAWISPSQNLSCTCLSEIALLFRSSDSLLHDLCEAYDSCSDKASSRPESFFLALRKWYPSLKPEMEFRCFVKSNELVGVCQREVTTFYPVLVNEKELIKGLIEEFFYDSVRDVFELEDYAFDVYVTKERRVKVVDFNTWCGSTLPLMFSWDELEKRVGGGELELRIVESRLGVLPGLKTAVPYDYIDMSSGSGWDQVLKKAEEELRDEDRS